MNQHTVVFTVKRVNPGSYQHSELVSLIWAVFSKTSLGEEQVKKLHDEHVPSPFTWSYSKVAKNEVSISWSSIKDELIGEFTKAAKSLEDKAVTVPGSAYIIKDVYPVEDISYIPPRMTLHSLSGISVQRVVDNKIRPLWHRDDEENWTSRMEKKLMHKVELYAPAGEHHVKIDRVKPLTADKTKYNGMTFVAPMYQFRLTADENAMKVALYAGVGQHCGIGFGHVVP